MKKQITITALLITALLRCSEATAETFVVSRTGAEVSATRDGKAWAGKGKIDRKDPTVLLAAFFKSYFERTDEWKDFVAGIIGAKENAILYMEEDYVSFYGRADSVSITIDPEKFEDNGGVFADYTVKIAYTYKGESGEDEDQVAMAKDEDGGWVVVELPR